MAENAPANAAALSKPQRRAFNAHIKAAKALEAAGQDAEALRQYEQACAVFPSAPGLAKRIRKLAVRTPPPHDAPFTSTHCGSEQPGWGLKGAI